MGFVYCVGIVNIHFKLTILNKARLGLVVDVMCITSLFWVRISLLVVSFSESGETVVAVDSIGGVRIEIGGGRGIRRKGTWESEREVGFWRLGFGGGGVVEG